MEYIKDTDSNKTRDIVYMSVFTAMISICSWISIPASIPFTLQTMGVFTTVGLIGGKRGTLTILTYILLGAIGIPVFAGLTGGISVLLGTTGGYIMGFLLSALLMWGIETIMGRNQIVLAFSMIAGLIVCYVFGTAWFMLIYTQHSGVIGLSTVLGLCVIPFIIPDLIKIGVALFLTNRLKKR